MAEGDLFSARLPYLGTVGNDQVEFGGLVDAHWGDADNNRRVEGTRFIIDRKYYELLGKPEFIIVGISTEEGFETWVGPSPNANMGVWLEATDAN